MKFALTMLTILALTLPVFGQSAYDFSQMSIPKKAPQEFQFFSYFISQYVYNNIYAQNDFLKGQTVGRLFGGNTTTTSGGQSQYFEQRLIPFVIYQPRIFNGKALLRASFEIDWTWGDSAYGAGGNFGSAISGDQVNLQTQNVELELIPRTGWAINIGLQRLFDTPYNQYRTFFNTMTLSGYRLAFWGSDAVGVTVRRDHDYSRWKTGFYKLYENNIQEKDDVTLWEATYERDLTTTWRQGASLWYVHDRASGEGGVSILGQGLNSLLNDYNGTFRFLFGEKPYRANIYWLGTYWSRNPEFTLGRWGLSGFAISNVGDVEVHTEGAWDKGADILGFAGNLRAGYKYGQTAEDRITLDLIVTSGDDDGISDQEYSGVITGNTWGSPGAIFISHGAYLLFPHGNVVNRYIAAVTDISNMGLGLVGGTLNVQHDFIPHQLTAKIGTAAAVSMFEPDEGGTTIGTELNAMVGFQPKAFMNIELHAAYLALGDFYESPEVNGDVDEIPADPWTTFLVFKWLMF
ncbi:hypothetical protein ACFL27_19140 [candidate division CSSED10-310 bacterium]|uniref:Alginate export domain-containing protein n=1 Tax=candidate division CSSED10-310 bacterium TaxID=2855610 RepID=A0ABV6Z1L5_UNCC1